MAANPELTQYVAAHRAAGRSDAEIAKELQAAGWDSTNINLAMNLDESILPPPIPPSATAGIELAGAIVGSPVNDFKLELSDVGWSWGAFSLTWLWGVVNKVWLSLAFLIPGVNLIIGLPLGIYLGVKGRRLAFEAKKFNNIEDFRATQKAWDTWGAISFAVSMLLSVSLALFLISATGKDSAIYKERSEERRVGKECCR